MNNDNSVTSAEMRKIKRVASKVKAILGSHVASIRKFTRAAEVLTQNAMEVQLPGLGKPIRLYLQRISRRDPERILKDREEWRFLLLLTGLHRGHLSVHSIAPSIIELASPFPD